MPSKLLGILSVIFALLAVAIYLIFLRPLPTESATGTITRKSHKPAGTYWQYPAGMNRESFRTATPIPIAEADVFELNIDGFEAPVFFSTNVAAGAHYEPGQRIRIQYKLRSIPFAGKRVYVIDMFPAEQPE